MNVSIKKKLRLDWGAVLVIALTLFSCQEMNKWDDPAGNQQIEVPPPPEDKSARLLAKYTFENNLANELDNSIIGEALAQGQGKVPALENNTDRGGAVLHQYFGAIGGESYIRFANPLKGIEDLYGASISLWVNRLDANVWDAIWSFFDEDNSDGVDGRFYLTPNAYLGYNGTGGFFDCNKSDNAITNAIAVNDWNMVTVTVDVTGFNIYINGKLVYDTTKQLLWNANNGVTPDKFSYQSVVSLLKSSSYFYLGYGSWWGSANLLIDDLLIYKGVLTAAEISAMYNSYSGLVAYYNFESNLKNVVDVSSEGQLLKKGDGAEPVFEANQERGGTVLHQHFGTASNVSYAKFDNPLKGKDIYGATISLWINRPDANVWDAIWSFFDEDNSDGIDGRLYLTPNAYLGFNGTGGYFDCNWPENVTDAIEVGKWNMVTVTINVDGFAIYVNGQNKYNKMSQKSWGANDGITPSQFNYNHVVNLLKSSSYFYLGHGSWWGSAPLLIDDLTIYKRALSDAEILELYDSNK